MAHALRYTPLDTMIRALPIAGIVEKSLSKDTATKHCHQRFIYIYNYACIYM